MLEFNATILIQLANFLVMMWFLHTFLFKPVLQKADEREKTLDNMRSEAEKLAADAERIFGEYNSRSAELKKESSGLLVQARLNAVAEQDRLMGEAREKYSKLMEDGLADVESGIAKVRGELKREAEILSKTMAARLLGRAL